MLSAAAVAGAAMIWNTSFTFTKIALVEIPPLTIGALRFLLAAVVLGGVVWVQGNLEGGERRRVGWC